MPCKCDYLEPLGFEKALSEVACLLDEVCRGKPINREHFSGFHPDVYCKNLTTEERDRMVQELCSLCQTIDVSKYSLELQIWWRDHQEADKKRIEEEKEKEEIEKKVTIALNKLTDEEKRLLGL